jgi:hypothetical protein
MHFAAAAREALISVLAALAALVALVADAGVSDLVLVAIITSFVTLVLGTLTFVGSIYQIRHLAANSQKLDLVGKNVDGKLTALVEATARANRAEGVIEGGDKADAKASGVPATSAIETATNDGGVVVGPKSDGR